MFSVLVVHCTAMMVTKITFGNIYHSVISLNELLTTDSSYNYCPYTYTVMSNIVMSTLNQADKSFSTESQGDE